MTGLELQTRILKRLGDDPTVDVSNMYYQPSEVLTALNQLQRMFVLLTLCLETTAAMTLDGSTFYRMLTIYADWIVPLRVRSSAKKLKPRRLTDLAALDSMWTQKAGVTDSYSHNGMDLLAVYKQSSVTLSVTYARTPVDIADDTEPEIPLEFHPSLIAGAIPLLSVKEGGQEWQKRLDSMWNDFMQAIRLCADQVRKRNLEQGYDAMPPEIKRYDLSHLKTKVG